MLGPSHSVRRRPKGIAIRPEAVRQARLEKGLSLADLAGGQVTRAAMHLVETGKMRPSMRTLQLIARRTDRPVSYFLAEPEGSDAQRKARDEVLRLVDTDDLSAAIALGSQLLAESLEPGMEADVRFGLGRAHVRMAQGEEALRHLTRAHELFERVGDTWMVAHVLDQEAVAMFLVGDPRTLSRALEALERCERLEPAAPALHANVLNVLGNIYMRRHDWRTAARFFEMGLQAGSGVVDLRLTARLHDGLSSARQRLGDFGAALRSAERAVAIHAADSNPMALIRATNNLGYALLRQGELDAAASHLRRALELCDEHDVQRIGRAHVLNSLGELHLARGEPRLAETHLLLALEVAQRMREADSEATARHLLGRAYLQLGEERAADAAFGAAIGLLRELDLPERLRDCAMEYADLLQRRGLLEESIGFWRTAAEAGCRSQTDSQESAALIGQTGA